MNKFNELDGKTAMKLGEIFFSIIAGDLEPDERDFGYTNQVEWDSDGVYLNNLKALIPSDVRSAVMEIIGDDEPYDPTGKSREQIDAELGYLSDDERGALSDLMRAQL